MRSRQPFLILMARHAPHFGRDQRQLRYRPSRSRSARYPDQQLEWTSRRPEANAPNSNCTSRSTFSDYGVSQAFLPSWLVLRVRCQRSVVAAIGRACRHATPTRSQSRAFRLTQSLRAFLGRARVKVHAVWPVPWTPTDAMPRHPKFSADPSHEASSTAWRKATRIIFPDPMSESIAEGFFLAQRRTKALERQFPPTCPQSAAKCVSGS